MAIELTQAIILSIGDELVLGQTVDTNSAWLAQRLAAMGISTRYHQTLADDRETIAQAITQAAQQAKLVLITGGLGPTADDLTRPALADALHQPLVAHPPSLERLEAFFSQRGRPMPERNRVQAMLPRGAEAIRNNHGTAPGIRATLSGATLYVLPGVPREMIAMFHEQIEPELHPASDEHHVILTTKINTFGAGESSVAEQLANLMDRQQNPMVGTTVADGIVSVRVRSEFPGLQQAREALEDTVADVEQRLGPIAFGRDEQTLQESVVHLLEHQGQHLVTAESCTGGLLGKMISDVPGSSAVYPGGWITYANAMKLEQLGVSKAVLDEHGAVSEPTVRAMAEGALRHCRAARLSLAITGIAGPTGGTADKPVGTVWLALARRDEHDPQQLHCRAVQALLPGDRDAVRDRAAKCALQMLRLDLLGVGLEHLQWIRPGARQP